MSEERRAPARRSRDSKGGVFGGATGDSLFPARRRLHSQRARARNGKGRPRRGLKNKIRPRVKSRETRSFADALRNNFTPQFPDVQRGPAYPYAIRKRTYTRARAIRHACTHREAYGRRIVIRRDDCTSWCSSVCNRCASPSAITRVSTTVKARMCTGCNSIYLRARGTYARVHVRTHDASTTPFPGG